MPLIRARRSSIFPFRVAAAGQGYQVPSSANDFAGSASNRISADLSGYAVARLTMRANGVGDAGAKIKVQYSTDESAWSDLGCEVVADEYNLVIGAWATIPAAAKGPAIHFRIAGYDGAATLSGSYANILMEVK